MPAGAGRDRAQSGHQLALVAALEHVLEGTNDPHVAVAGALTASPLTNLEQRVDLRRRGALVGHLATPLLAGAGPCPAPRDGAHVPRAARDNSAGREK